MALGMAKMESKSIRKWNGKNGIKIDPEMEWQKWNQNLFKNGNGKNGIKIDPEMEMAKMDRN